jgi:hypothetical protein
MAQKTLVVQSYRTHDVPAWIARCLASVEGWARMRGYDYRLTGDEVFALCGAEYLARVGPNMRSITNLARLELIAQALADGYDRAMWIDADVHVFDPAAFSIDSVRHYAFARETWIAPASGHVWTAEGGVNNCCIVFTPGQPDLRFLIDTTRHVAMHREIRSNYQVGGDLIKGLRRSLAFETLDNVAMFNPHVVVALARRKNTLLRAQAQFHGSPVYAGNLCASSNYGALAGEEAAMAAIDRLESTRGAILNQWIGAGGTALAFGEAAHFDGPDIAVLNGTAPDTAA